MKTRFTILKLLSIMFGIFATTAVFGQQTAYTWIGTANGTNLQTAGNWTTNGTTPATTLPSGATQDLVEWSGSAAGNLELSYGGNSWPATGFGSSGVYLWSQSTQVGSVQIYSPVSKSAGVGVFEVENDSTTGSLILGDNSANNWLVFARPGTAGTDHIFYNYGATSYINPSIEWQAGGGVGWTFDFQGTGNWVINSYLIPDNNPSSPMVVSWNDTGTLIWSATPGRTNNYTPTAPMANLNVNSGTVVLASAFSNPNILLNTPIADAATLVYAPLAGAPDGQVLNGAITGTGSLVVSNGTLTVGGQNTYSGGTTLNGGELIVNSVENPGTSGPLGLGGLVNFYGGTLGYGANTFDYDYSSSFNTADGQQYNIDTAGQNVTFATGLVGANAVNKIGAGTLTLTGSSTYTGATTIAAGGRLLFQGSKTGIGNITVADSGTLGLYDTGTPIKPATLTLGSSSGCTLGFNNIHSAGTAPLQAGALSSTGTITINVLNSTFNTIGATYPLFSWTSGSAPTVALGTLSGASGTLSIVGNSVVLTITATPYIWTGLNGNSSWDLSSANNWVQSGVAKTYTDGVLTLFDDTGINTSITINSPVSPQSVSLNNSSVTYNIASSGANNITGSTGLTQGGGATNTLSGGANTYTGATTVNAGVLSVGALANGGSPSDIGASSNNGTNLVLDGGTLLYTGSGASIDRLFTLGPGNGTVDSSGGGALNLTNNGSIVYSAGGPRALTLQGSTFGNTLASILGNSPGGPSSLIKNGTNSWALTGANTYSGSTTINAGTLQVGSGGSLGSGPVINNSSLDFNVTNSTLVSGVISGNGSLTNDGTGTAIIANDNTYSGNTVINAGTLQIGNGGSSGSLISSAVITNNANLVYNSSGTYQNNGGGIFGTGNLTVNKGFLQLVDNVDLTGWTTISPGARVQIFLGNVGTFFSSVITNNGGIIFIRQDNNVAGYSNNITGSGYILKEVSNANPGDVTLAGNNTYAGPTFIAGGGLLIGDGVTPGTGSIVGNVIFTNSVNVAVGADDDKFITFMRPDNYTFAGNITTNYLHPQNNPGRLLQLGAGVLTLTGNNNYDGSTTITNSVLQIGNGGGTGTLGSGFVTSYGTLVFNRSGLLNVTANITGPGSVVNVGPGQVTLSGVVTNSGGIIVSNGTLVVTTGTVGFNDGVDPAGGDLTLDGGTFVPFGFGSADTNFIVGNNLNINSGTLVASVNRSVASTNYVVTGAINAAGGSLTLRLINVGQPLVPGDKLYIFSQPVTGLSSVNLVTPGFTVNNLLSTDGSVTVQSVASSSATVTNSVSGGNFNLSWSSAFLGLHLQVQTNSLSVGLSTNWVTIPGTDTGTTYSTPINTTKGTVFFRLAP